MLLPPRTIPLYAPRLLLSLTHARHSRQTLLTSLTLVLYKHRNVPITSHPLRTPPSISDSSHERNRPITRLSYDFDLTRVLQRSDHLVETSCIDPHTRVLLQFRR